MKANREKDYQWWRRRGLATVVKKMQQWLRLRDIWQWWRQIEKCQWQRDLATAVKVSNVERWILIRVNNLGTKFYNWEFIFDVGMEISQKFLWWNLFSLGLVKRGKMKFYRLWLTDGVSRNYVHNNFIFNRTGYKDAVPICCYIHVFL